MNYVSQLRQEMARQGMSQYVLAGRLGVSAPAVNQWLNGKAKVPEARRAQIEAALDWVPAQQVDASDLVALYRQAGSPMAFVLQEQVPQDLVPGGNKVVYVEGTQEYLEWALMLWAKRLGCEEQHLLLVAQRQEYLDKWQLAAVYKAGLLLSYLGEHLGERLSEAEQVQQFLLGGIEPAAVQTWEALRAALREAEAEEPRRGVAPSVGRQAAIEVLENAGHRLPTPADTVYEMWQELNT